MEDEISRKFQEIQMNNSSQASQQAIFLKLPLEIRRMIYNYVLDPFDSPLPEKIYFAEEPIVRLPPASLYSVNRQIQIELRTDFAKEKGTFVLHITPQGVLYSTLSETLILAGQTRDLTQASKVVITVWPPHLDRPADIFEIWRTARAVQRQLIRANSLQLLRLQFYNNELASWCPHGKILDTLNPEEYEEYPEADEEESGWNDISNITEVFCRVRTVQGQCGLGPELRAFEDTIDSLDDYSKLMEGRDEVPDCYHREITLADKERYDQNLEFGDQEVELQKQGTKIAIQKLIELTCDGRKKMSVMEWYRFLEIWNPHFETLSTSTWRYPWLTLRERFCRR